MSAGGVLDVVVHALAPDGDGVVLVELRPVDPRTTLPSFDAGAHIDLHVGGVTRQYSLVGGGPAAGYYLIGVLRTRDSRGGSEAVHALDVGDRVAISPPRNSFPLDPEATHSVLIAGGLGGTPIVAMGEELHRPGPSFAGHV